MTGTVPDPRRCARVVTPERVVLADARRATRDRAVTSGSVDDGWLRIRFAPGNGPVGLAARRHTGERSCVTGGLITLQ